MFLMIFADVVASTRINAPIVAVASCRNNGKQHIKSAAHVTLYRNGAVVVGEIPNNMKVGTDSVIITAEAMKSISPNTHLGRGARANGVGVAIGGHARAGDLNVSEQCPASSFLPVGRR